MRGGTRGEMAPARRLLHAGGGEAAAVVPNRSLNSSSLIKSAARRWTGRSGGASSRASRRAALPVQALPGAARWWNVPEFTEMHMIEPFMLLAWSDNFVSHL
ncbi:hypothetical protein BS78_01G122300 [Paspalum vaginatum]|nr:hypothetical protein BS78_01G122300 [Paspalum vaginatum]